MITMLLHDYVVHEAQNSVLLPFLKTGCQPFFMDAVRLRQSRD